MPDKISSLIDWMRASSTSWATGLLNAVVLVLWFVFPGGNALAENSLLPDAPGREQVVQVCLQCHPAELVVMKRRSAEEWQDVIMRMREHGARGSDDQFEAILNYLAAIFGGDDAAVSADVQVTRPALLPVASARGQP